MTDFTASRSQMASRFTDGFAPPALQTKASESIRRHEGIIQSIPSRAGARAKANAPAKNPSFASLASVAQSGGLSPFERQRVVVELGDKLHQAFFAADARAAVKAENRKANAAHEADLRAKRQAAPDAVAKFDREKPTAEHVAKHGAEMVALGDLDPGRSGRAVRVGDGWRPRLLFKKGRLSKRQFDAAKELADLWEAAGFHRIKGQAWAERVDGGAAFRGGLRGCEARARFLDAMAALPVAARAVVGNVVIEGGALADALAGAGDAAWLPKCRKQRDAWALATLHLGLDLLALHFFA